MVRDGEISFSSKLKRVRETRANYADYSRDAMVKHYAFMETLLYYFDDEWFDDDRYYRDHKKTKSYVQAVRSRGDAITPQRCVECKRPFQRIIPTPHKGNFAYINSELFANIPLEDGVCGNCE